jgi:hypothetical protein
MTSSTVERINVTCFHKTHLWYNGIYFSRVCDLTAGQNIHQFTCNSTVKNVHVNSNALFLPLCCFRCSITCSSTVKNVHVNSNALFLPLYCYRCSITLFLPLIWVADVWCARCGLPLQKPFAWMKDFAWQPHVPTDCRTVPTNVILHPIGVSLRPFVSLVT